MVCRHVYYNLTMTIVYSVQISVPSHYLQTGRRSKEHRYFLLGYIRGRGWGWNRDRNWSRGGHGDCRLGDWGGGGRDVSAMVLSSVGLQGGHSLVAALAHWIELEVTTHVKMYM